MRCLSVSVSLASKEVLLLGLALVLASACQPAIPGTGTVGDNGGPTADGTIQNDGSSDSGGPPPARYPDDSVPPVVTLSTPANNTTTEAQTMVVSGVATDDLGISALTVQVGLNVAAPVGTPAADGSFTFEIPLAVGTQPVIVRAYDLGGNVGSAQIDINRSVQPVGNDQPPTLVIDAPVDDFVAATTAVYVSGTAADDVGLAKVELRVDGAAGEIVQTGDNFEHWFFVANVFPNASGQNVIEVRATDSAGQTTLISITGSTTAVADDTPPVITITSPADGFATTTDSVTVTGTASDDTSVEAVTIRVGDGPYQTAASSDDFATWTADLTLPPGTHVVKARAVDSGGIATTTTITVTNTSGDVWGPPKTVSLGWAAPDYAASTFALDKAGLSEMMTDEVADQLVMLQLDVKPLVQSSIESIKGACGPAWATQDVSGNCPSIWGQSEINMFRLVTMTPTNVNVAGTSIAGMEQIASVLGTFGLIDSFSEILAAGLGIDEDEAIVQSPAVVDAMLDNVLATHPKMLPGPLMPVTMLDALSDMTTLGAKFDADGAHPGFVSASSGTFAKVLLDSFEMTMVATSNLHWHDGVDLATGKSYIPFVADVTGPTFDDVLEFDFLGAETFSVDGIAANPTVSLTFQLFENDSWISIGTSRFPEPRGNSAVWSLNPWELEHVFADASFRQYKNHRAGCSLCEGSDEGALLYEAIGVDEAELVVGHAGYDKDPLIGGPNGVPEHFDVLSNNPAGWLRIWTLFGLGSPPEPQYVWDMVLEVAERRLLDGGVAQGDGDVAFPLLDIPVGLTAAEIKSSVRPILESQKSKLSDLLLGDYKDTALSLDFFLAKGDDGKVRLYFVDSSDPVPDGTAIHTNPGFFADESLATKLSSTASGGSGDTTHEKIDLDVQQTVYCTDKDGMLYRVQIEPAVDDSVTLTVRSYVGQP